MKSAKKSILDQGITRIELPFPIITKNSFSNVLYERPFYNDLLKRIRSINWIVLIGNPGIAKSYFQYYYLARILNPSLFGPLPPDHLGSTEPPKFIVRQVGKSMFLYSLEDSRAFFSSDFSSMVLRLLGATHPSHSLYWYEPAETKDIPITWNEDVPMLATVSADIRRYEEYQKFYAVTKGAMPVWSEEELQSVGKDMRLRMEEGSTLYEFFSPEKISDRFKKYGGIFRFVLTTSTVYLRDVDVNRSTALQNANVDKLLLSSDIQSQHASSYVLHYDVVTKGEHAFMYTSMKFASQEVEKIIIRKGKSMPLSDAIEKMIAMDTGSLDDKEYLAPVMFERIHWQVKKAAHYFSSYLSQINSNVNYS